MERIITDKKCSDNISKTNIKQIGLLSYFHMSQTMLPDYEVLSDNGN